MIRMMLSTDDGYLSNLNIISSADLLRVDRFTSNRREEIYLQFNEMHAPGNWHSLCISIIIKLFYTVNTPNILSS